MAWVATKESEGNVIPWKNNSGVTKNLGDPVFVGSRLGILVQGANQIDTTLANAATGDVAVDGVWRLPSVTTDTGVEGQACFWDTVAAKITTNPVQTPAANVAPGLIYAGRLARIKANGDTIAAVKLNDACDEPTLHVTFPDQATNDITITNPYPFALRLVDALIENTAANGANANTIQVCAAAAGGSPITDAMSLNAVAANGLVRAAQVQTANAAIAAITNFFIRQTKAGGTMGGIVRMRFIRA
jgi:predicted RecA/RadA family phage recombinase